MNGMPVPPRKFKVLLHAPKLEGEVQELQPEGYSEQHTTLAKYRSGTVQRAIAGAAPVQPADDGELDRRSARAWGIAREPFMQLFYLGLMMWFAGNQLTVWSIFILIPALQTPFMRLMAVNEVFKVVAHEKLDLTVQKAVYVLLCVAGVALALAKVHWLGLLPVTSADWVGLLQAHDPLEHSAAAIPVLAG